MMKRLLALVAIILVGSTTAAIAQDMVSGQYEYMNNCASCHGEDGMGKGPLVTFFKEPVPDLTVMTLNNDGVFPFHHTIKVIDGREGLRGHGNPMPVWGNSFELAAMAEAGDPNAFTIARGRVLSLVEYLVTIQQD